MKNEMKEKKEYMAPELTVVTFKAERGYATSSLSAAFFGLGLGQSHAADGQETWQIDNYSGTEGWIND